MSKAKTNQLIGTLKKVVTTSKVDDNGRQIHTVTTQIELIENGGIENIHDIAQELNKPMRLDFDAVQLELE